MLYLTGPDKQLHQPPAADPVQLQAGHRRPPGAGLRQEREPAQPGLVQLPQPDLQLHPRALRFVQKYEKVLKSLRFFLIELNKMFPIDNY